MQKHNLLQRVKLTSCGNISEFMLLLLCFLVFNWYNRSDELVSVYVPQPVRLSCPSYITPVWKTLVEGYAVEFVQFGNHRIDRTLVMASSPPDNSSGVYFCYGSNRNGTTFKKTFLVYTSCKLF